MTYLIRQATPDDADELAPVAARIFVETFAWENDPDVLADYVALRMTPYQLRYEIGDDANRFFLVYAPASPPDSAGSGEIIAHVKMRFPAMPPRRAFPARTLSNSPGFLSARSGTGAASRRR